MLRVLVVVAALSPLPAWAQVDGCKSPDYGWLCRAGVTNSLEIVEALRKEPPVNKVEPPVPFADEIKPKEPRRRYKVPGHQ